MFGNSLGWKISIFIFVLNAGAALWLYGEMEITEPTNLSMDEKNLAVLTPPAPSETVVEHDQPGDAGEKYVEAIAAYEADSDACDQYADKPDGPPPGPMQSVIDATNLSSMNLFGKNPSAIVNYQSDHAPLEDLSKLGAEMETAGLRLARDGKPSEAKRLFLAVYSLGENLLGERLNYDEYSHGIGLMDGAATALADLEPGDSQHANMLRNQSKEMVSFDQTSVRPIYDVLASADAQRIGVNAGDVIRFARLAKERMFRVEAILKLGRYRFDSVRGADQLAAPGILGKLAEDPDPVIQAAARAGLGLTIEEYRMIH
jgi:hypothetical protein